MAKLLRILIVVLLLFSIASLVLGIMLFNQREALKGRTQVLEQATATFAQNIHTEFSVDSIKDYASMQAPLDQLAVQAQNQYEELQNTKKDLETTRTELAATRTELESTKTQLAEANTKIGQLNTDLEQTRAELAQTKEQVAQAEQERDALKEDTEELRTAMTQLEEKLRDLEVEHAAVVRERDDLLNKSESGPMVKGVAGNVLLVNPDWNFVILNVGSQAGLQPAAELLVQRSDRLVGRVRISAVKNQLAVAEIISDWIQSPLQEGDRVISPES